ncbi:hypothetical protein K8I31_05765, partial [bacterium]|nr:hypothetical protein [bacterium]
MESISPIRITLFCLLSLLAATLARTAWMCDDAYITFRVVDNWANGYGMRWNVSERVQAYTHPLWMLCIASLHLFTHEIYYATLLFSMALTLAAAGWFAFKIADASAAALLGLAAMTLSKAFVEYGTSGLENPLNYLLLALFYWRYLKG